jgi:hypothetical protein
MVQLLGGFLLGVNQKIETSQQLQDVRLTPKTCRGLRHNKVIGKVKVCDFGYVVVII